MREVVDMPNQRLDLLLRLLHQHGGKLAAAKRGRFAELTDDELGEIEKRFNAAFND